ncbi:hypothetical protein [Methylobacter sp. BBA5.1]|uniref:hypothetical protein n=1 Tax=Methylobacter sp. BBA5.1 TaxID=1495064 RepID=UPI00190FA548|nr:hypothetical protein [Methylobacter sp. BBA5.1]
MKTTIKRLRSAIVLITVLLVTGNVEAAILSGDFRTESDLPYCCGGGRPLVHENIGAPVGDGAELTGANFVENPSNWGGGVVHMDLDPLTNILTLHSQDIWDFETFDAWITNIVFDAGERITGLSLISGNITDLGLAAILNFSDNSVHIRYDVGAGNPTFDFTGGRAQFQITTDVSAVPVPAAVWLFGSGLMGLLGFNRKRAQPLAA